MKFGFYSWYTKIILSSSALIPNFVFQSRNLHFFELNRKKLAITLSNLLLPIEKNKTKQKQNLWNWRTEHIEFCPSFFFSFGPASMHRGYIWLKLVLCAEYTEIRIQECLLELGLRKSIVLSFSTIWSMWL